MSDSSSGTATLLGGRYRLLREIARGGMATVFQALDEVLERDVAMKLLHRHLAADPTFLDRFLREARAAAALSHPNVVSVYDWGEDGGQAYLVMEFVNGPSLRDVLRRRNRLTPGETAAVLVPAAAGIAAAHARGIVHRDVKPENILVSSDGPGVVKVTDFGLARAAAATTQTFAPGAIVGSPHYLAPEAVRDERLDARTDVYALGVVLYECLVGRPPFEAETPVATALRHTAEAVPPPSAMVDVPAELDEVVSRATAPEPSDRFSDASVFQAALDTAAPRGEIPTGRRDDERGTLVIPPETVDTLVPGPTASAAGQAVPLPRAKPPAPRPEELPPPQIEPSRKEPVTAAPGSRRRRLLIAGLVGIVLLLGGLYLAWDTLVAPVTPIPEVVGQPRTLAEATLRGAGFEPMVADEREFSLDVLADHVIRQVPTGSARVGTTVTLTLSAGPRPVPGGVPNLVGKSEQQATAILQGAGLAPTMEYAYDEKMDKGLVVRTDPSGGAPITEGQPVTVVVSKGRRPIEVPKVVGLTVDDASARLSSLGLKATVGSQVFHETAAPGVVVSQNPEPGAALHRGDVVRLSASKGPETFPMPDVRGRSRDEAVTTLEDLGLVVEVREVMGFFRPDDEVAEQDPKPGTSVRRGERVTLFVWR